jgi:hypothetical protein
MKRDDGKVARQSRAGGWPWHEKRSTCRWIWLAVTFLALACSPCNCCSLYPAPASPYASENRLQDVLGKVEPVVLAEREPMLASVSPDGKWMLVLLQDSGPVLAIDLEHNQEYEVLPDKGSHGQWLNESYAVVGRMMLHVPSLETWRLESRYPDPDSLDVLEGADHVYALENLTGGGSVLVTTDPAFPYWVSVNWEGTELGEHLSGIPHTIIQAGGIHPDPNQKHYSPDGRYYMLDVGQAYLEGVRFTRKPLGYGPVMFDAATGQEIARALKRDWDAYFLGWAYDSSGAYFMFIPSTADADLLHPRHPIYKLLVPGATPRGTPMPMYTPTPTRDASVPPGATVIPLGTSTSPTGP